MRHERATHGPRGTHRAVSCASAKSCVAVGSLDQYRDTGHPAPLIEEWDGLISSVAAAASVPGATACDLTGVASLATGYVAVGSSTAHGTNGHTLVEQRP